MKIVISSLKFSRHMPFYNFYDFGHPCCNLYNFTSLIIYRNIISKYINLSNNHSTINCNKGDTIYM